MISLGAVVQRLMSVGTTSAAPPDDASPDAGRRWVAATKEAREALKWVVTAIAATAAVAFGAGPILIVPKIDISVWEWWRYVLFFLGSVAGAVGVVVVISALVRAMLPTELTLRELPTDFVATIDREARWSLPGNAESVDDFKQRLTAYRRAPAKLDAMAAREPDRAKQALLAAAAANARKSYQNYRAVEAELLEQAGYRLTVDRVTQVVPTILGGALLAVTGMGVFQVATSSPTVSAGSTPTYATLIKQDHPAGAQLWQVLRLDGCEAGTAGRIGVLVTSGRGTSNEPYVVQTLDGVIGCPAVSFTVEPNLATVAIPRPPVVTISTAPSPTPTS